MEKKLVIRDAGGTVINIGPWDYQMEPVMGNDLENPIFDDGGELSGYHQKQIRESPRNPLPEGAYEDEVEIVTGPDGGLYASENYRALRVIEYPPIGDQMDALFKAGVFPPEMAALIQAIKDKFPKPA